MPKTYEIRESKGEQAITCLICAMTSYNPNDVSQRYCGNCHEFHDLLALKRQVEALKKET